MCLDNLIASGDMPVTIAVLVAPGSQTDEDGSQRSLEYDTVSARYTDFLAHDILPLVEAEFNITDDPAQRCATGGSSGGICAFSCAFFRPDLFGKAISWIGSFTNIRYGALAWASYVAKLTFISTVLPYICSTSLGWGSSVTTTTHSPVVVTKHPVRLTTTTGESSLRPWYSVGTGGDSGIGAGGDDAVEDQHPTCICQRRTADGGRSSNSGFTSPAA